MSLKFFVLGAALFCGMEAVQISTPAVAQDVKTEVKAPVSKAAFNNAIDNFVKAGVSKVNFEALDELMIQALDDAKRGYTRAKDDGNDEASRSAFNRLRERKALYSSIHAQVMESEIVDAEKVKTALRDFAETL